MTKEYAEKLTQLKNELVVASREIEFKVNPDDTEFIEKWMIFMAKLNYLAGYISALENHEHKTTNHS